MLNATASRIGMLVGLVAIASLAAAPIADARGGGRGGGRGGFSSGGFGGQRGGGIRGGASTSISRPPGGYGGGSYGGHGGAGQRPGGRGDRGDIGGGNRGDIGSGNRTNIGNGDRYTNINVNNNWNAGHWGGGWYDHPIAAGVAIGAVATMTAAAIGTAYYALPPGCASASYRGYAYYSCGGAYYAPTYESDTVVYVTIPDPNANPPPGK